jgi:hypothetical protein
MKHIFIAILLVFFVSANAQKLEKVWETDSIVAIPESVLPDPENGLLYISLINGGPWEADGKGGIARMKDDGTGYDSTWVTGLNAPKGMGLHKNRLYVADLAEVVVIDVPNAKVEKRIPIEGASGLNDITVSNDGVVYVSDSKTAKVWRIENDTPQLFLENMQGVNGLKAVGADLMVASGKTFLKADAKKATTKLTELPQGGDGVEPIGNGDYLVSAWMGQIYHVSANGKVETLLDTSVEKRNTADIGYNPQKRMIYVPTFFARTVAAYRLK